MRPQHAFSLVELSIVLVILGLLTGGILAGQSLIRAAEMRSVNAEFQRYTIALGSFRDKYFAIPGDMDMATQVWGVNTDATACKTTASSTTQTCDGDGNRYVGWNALGNNDNMYERFSFWKHLSNAGLVEGNYTGVAGPDGVLDVVAGSNSPSSRLNGGIWGAAARLNAAADTNWYAGARSTANFLLFGGETGSGANWGLVLKAEEAWNIDTKVDDGKPAFGTIVSLKPSPSTIMPNCATSATDASAEYNLGNSTMACALIQFMPF